MSICMSDTFTVSVYFTPMSFPFNFTVHTWVELVSSDGEIHRFDFWGYSGLRAKHPNSGYVYKNLFPDHLGTTFSPIANPNEMSGRQIGCLYDSVTGNGESVACRLSEAILECALKYPQRHSYNMIYGPNCNSYTQWLITLVPDSPLRLPWNAWGKGYVKKDWF